MDSELTKLIESGESGTVEFKESFGRDAIETISAFANGEGGFLCVGVGNKGKVKGVVATEEKIKDWLNQLKMATEPSLFPQYNVCDYDGRRVVLFIVQEYPLKPVACKGRYFKRHGASNHLLTSDEIVELKIQSMNASFDAFDVNGGIDSLDREALGKFARYIERSGRFNPSGDIERDLGKLGFMKDGRLTRAAELLFGNHHTAIHLGRFKSRDTIVDEHVEFTNPGELFGNLKLEALYTDFYRASHRNKLLAEAFYLTGEVEKYGTGFIRIRNHLRDEYSDMGFVLDSDSGAFRVSVGVLTAPPITPPNHPPSYGSGNEDFGIIERNSLGIQW